MVAKTAAHSVVMMVVPMVVPMAALSAEMLVGRLGRNWVVKMAVRKVEMMDFDSVGEMAVQMVVMKADQKVDL